MNDLYRWNPDTAIEEVWKAVQVEPLRQDLIRDGVLVPVEPVTVVTTDGTAPVFIGLEAGKYLIVQLEADDE